MPSEGPAERWSDADAYDAYVGRWSRLVARDFLSWLGVDAQRRWLDVGAGTGALSTTIAATAEPRQVVGIDSARAYVNHARRRVDDPRVRFEQGDAGALPYDAEFDVAVAGLVLNFVGPGPTKRAVDRLRRTSTSVGPGPTKRAVDRLRRAETVLPDTEAAVAGMRRAVTAGGLVAAYVWDYAGRMELLRHFWDAAVAVDPAARELDEGVRFPICDPHRLAALWREVGLRAVETTPLDVATPFRDFDDYWAPFLGGQGPAPAYVMSLPEPRRAALREAVRASLPIAADGSISMVARAWAVKGRR
jgi:SAM-dependent methyltransferase